MESKKQEDRKEKARRKAFTLYEGKLTPHRSCGICLAETFGLPTRPYQSLRRGGITGEGECGAIKAGELILGEFLGDPDPTGKVTERLRQAMAIYRELWQGRVDRGKAKTIVCNDLTGQFPEFQSPERLDFCTNIAAAVAECVAETLDRLGVAYEITDNISKVLPAEK
jgi:hypothetical protein